MTQRWHFWLIVAVIIIGLIAVFFWPVPVPDEPAMQPAVEKPVPAPSGKLRTDSLVNPPKSIEPDASSAETDASLLNAQAVNAWHAGDISGAMTLFEQAIDAFPDDPEPHSEYGRLLTLMVSYEKALPLVERARDLKPNDAQMWLDLATLYERVQAFDKSWAAQAQAAKLVGSEAITRDEQGRFIVKGTSLW